MPTPPTIWTVGHSTRSIDELLKILAAGQIKLLADVRRFPGSRRHPQFNQDALAASLAEAEIEYRHFVDLGGRRSKRLPDSPNTAWRSRVVQRLRRLHAVARIPRSPR